MARGLKDGLLRFRNGAWRDNDGDSVDIAEVVHGEWLNMKFTREWPNMKFTTELLCSNCFKRSYIPITKTGRKPYNYCPNCGAKMDGDKNV